MLRGNDTVVGEGREVRQLAAIVHAAFTAGTGSPTYYGAGWCADLQIGPARKANRVAGGQLQIETNVGTCAVGLMDFHSEHIRTRGEETNTHSRRVKGVVVDGTGSKRCVGNSAARHIASVNLRAIQVDNSTIVAQQTQCKTGVGGRIGNIEGMPEVSRDVFRRGIRPVTHHGCFATVAIAQLSRSRSPAAVVERS